MNNLNKFNNRSYKLSTLSNSDLYSICIKLKLKLNGIYMKDEIPTDLKNYKILMKTAVIGHVLSKIKIMYITMIVLL
jgi:hypothetical protein